MVVQFDFLIIIRLLSLTILYSPFRFDNSWKRVSRVRRRFINRGRSLPHELTAMTIFMMNVR